MAAEIVIHSRKKVIFTNLTQYELFQEESDSIKAGLYFSIPQDKIRKSEIFTTFEKIHHSFLNNLKSEDTKSQIKAHPSHLANSYFYNCIRGEGLHVYYINIVCYKTLETLLKKLFQKLLN